MSASSTTQPAGNTCRLLSLPAEIRNIIWELVVSREKLQYCKTTRLYGPLQYSQERLHGPPAITQVCQQVSPKRSEDPAEILMMAETRAEALPLYLATNTFGTDFTDQTARSSLRNFARTMGNNAANLKRLQLDGKSLAMMQRRTSSGGEVSMLRVFPIVYTFVIQNIQQPLTLKVIGTLGAFEEHRYTTDSVQMLHRDVQDDVQRMERRIASTMDTLIAGSRGYEIWIHVVEWSHYLQRIGVKRWAPGF